MSVLNRQMYISYSDLIGSPPYDVQYGYICWVTEEPDTSRVSMPGLPAPISGQVALLGLVDVVKRSIDLNLVTSITGSEFTAEIPNIPTPSGVSASITGSATPAVVGTSFTASPGGWLGRENSAGTVLPIQGYEYQWLRNGVDIVGATTNPYVAVLADEGSAVSCEVYAVTFGVARSLVANTTNSIAVTSGAEVLGDPFLAYDAAIGVLEAAADPAENLDYVQFWEDQGTAGVDATQNTVDPRPFYLTAGALDGYPHLDCLPFYEQHMLITGASSIATSWTLYAALYDNAGTGDAYLLDVELGPLRFALSTVAQGDNVLLYDGAWRTFGSSLADGQVLTWVLDGNTNLCRVFRGRTQLGTDQPYTPRMFAGFAAIGAAIGGAASFMDASVSRLALYPAAHSATLRTQVWDAWEPSFPTYL